jgi:hypothetical protein
MSTRMALGLVFSLTLMLQASHDYATRPVRLIEPFGLAEGPIWLVARLPKRLLNSGANL